MKNICISGKKLTRQDMQRINGGQQSAAGLCFNYTNNCTPCIASGCRCNYQQPGLYLCL
ncbi:hypothetical protein [Chitinophaga nivalis]|uniref:Bacteriocin n=1 Tax=Chitinophaga nivalis TaxID=2991709 RepID=A0ABT3IIX9_9BACT|nr:hypothetical protein [Chitinophaga nivalis]MCW3466387.1 hypothetical protein [Chitinophaga nivalis]MCW3483922.1 hypothetical protein [Chitinophaga nivalis]